MRTGTQGTGLSYEHEASPPFASSLRSLSAALAVTPSFPDELCPNFDSPTAALHSLQLAYRNKDIEAAIRCQDFRAEARLKSRRSGEALTETNLDTTAREREDAFRENTQQLWSDFSDVTSYISGIEHVLDEIFVATEVGSVGRGNYVRMIYMSFSKGQWKVIGPFRTPGRYPVGPD